MRLNLTRDKLCNGPDLLMKQLLLLPTQSRPYRQVRTNAMHRSATSVYSLGFNSIEQQLLLHDSGWQELHDMFRLVQLQLSITAAVESTIDAGIAKVDCTSLLRDEVLGKASAVVVAPVRQQLQIIEQLRSASRIVFIICWHPDAAEDVAMRWQAFEAGANMVTYCRHAVTEALYMVSLQQQQQQQTACTSGMPTAQQQHRRLTFSCDWCGLPRLSGPGYWVHQQLYHINHPNKAGTCQICHRHCGNLASHLHYNHNPTGQPPEPRTGVFALTVVRRPNDGKFLMTQEFAGSGFWVPGGGVDPGETLVGGAIRECREEAGVDVEIKGVLALESHHSGAWRRVIFRAEPVGSAADTASGTERSNAAAQRSYQHHELDVQRQQVPTVQCAVLDVLQQQGEAQVASVRHAATQAPQHQQASTFQQYALKIQQQLGGSWRSRVGSCSCCRPKTLPDWESAGACWVSVNDLQRVPLRSKSEPCTWFPVVDRGGEGFELPLYNSVQLPEEWAEGVFKGYPCT